MDTISIIVPVYNAGKFLEECLGSIFSQNYKYKEVIAIDDGSYDNSASILRKYSNRLRVHSQSNLGQSAARNAGLKLATGKFIMFLDADDYYKPNMISTLYNLIEHYDVACCGIDYITKHTFKHPIKGQFNKSDCDFSLSSRHVGNKLYRKSIIDDYNIYFPPGIVLIEDAIFLYLYQQFSSTYIGIPEGLYYYRRHLPGSTTWKKRGREEILSHVYGGIAFLENYYKLNHAELPLELKEQIFKMLSIDLGI